MLRGPPPRTGRSREYLFRMDLQRWLGSAVEAIGEWQDGFGPFEADPSLRIA